MKNLQQHGIEPAEIHYCRRNPVLQAKIADLSKSLQFVEPLLRFASRSR
jgi:hypothetical protein